MLIAPIPTIPFNGHAPTSESPASHVLRYGDRTANGVAGARRGVNEISCDECEAWGTSRQRQRHARSHQRPPPTTPPTASVAKPVVRSRSRRPTTKPREDEWKVRAWTLWMRVAFTRAGLAQGFPLRPSNERRGGSVTSRCSGQLTER